MGGYCSSARSSSPDAYFSLTSLKGWKSPEDDEHPELGLTDFFDRNARALSYCGDGKTVFCLQSHKSSREGPVLMAIWEDQNACTRGTPGLAQIFNMTPDEWAEITVFNTGKVYFTPDDVKHSPLPSPGTSKFVITGLAALDLCENVPGKDSTEQKFETAFSIRLSDLAAIPGKGIFGYYHKAQDTRTTHRGPTLNPNGPTLFMLWDDNNMKDANKGILWNILMWTDKKADDPSSPVAKVMDKDQYPASYDPARTGKDRWKSIHELGHDDKGMFRVDSNRTYPPSKLVM